MLGKLFSSAASSLSARGSANSSRPSSSLESVQEDIHTRNLLFPDAETLYQHQHDQVFPLQSSAVPILTSSNNAFDLNPEMELDARDVRVVVMQEATSMLTSAALLYDSHPLLEPAPSPVDRRDSSANGTIIPQRSVGRGSVSSPRRVSIGQATKPVVITQESTSPRNFGAFDGRRPSAHNRGMSHIETEGQRSVREYREEMNTFANCMFGSSDIMAYKGTGTKVHIVPTEPRALSSPFDAGHGSFGRSSMRSSSRLAQSYTSENVTSGPTSAGLPGTSTSYKTVDKRRVLITRIFPVPLLSDEEDLDGRTPTTQGSKSDDPSSYPFPKMSEGEKLPKEKKPKQKRTPMYAIGLIVQLPPSTHIPGAHIIRSGFRGPGSYTDQDSFPSSFSSLKPAGWTVLNNGFGGDSLESSFLTDFDERLESITQHWDIIMRTLSQLQKVVSENVHTLLKQADLASPLGPPVKTSPSSVSKSGKRVEETAKPWKIRSNIKPVQLMPNALMNHERIKTEVDFARSRIVSGVKIVRVVNRQGRWGIWREEARWVSKWAAGKEQGFFFYNLLTVFLGNHTDWLEALGPDWYRRRHYQQRRAIRTEDLSIPARTLIIGNDKMAARRLIFLLSTFLRQNQQQQIPFIRAHRPSTATSFGAYSQSPPSYVPLNLREESLRRRVNKRNGHRSAHSRTASLSSQVPSGLAAAHLRDSETERRHSDAGALKTANLPIPGSDGGTRKSSAATTTTVTPGNTIPHFSTRRPIRGTGPAPRPGSSGSLAADDLIRSLKRGDSTSQYSNGSADSQAHSLWGSVISGFWSNKRRGSTNDTALTGPSLEGLEIDPVRVQQRGKLAEMVDEVKMERNGSQDAPHEGPQKSNGSSINYKPSDQPSNLQETQSIPPGGIFESPVKATIDEDGVIDIDVPLPDFLTSSFGSAISSPSSSGFLSSHGFGPGIEGFEHYSRFGADEDSPVNVGGWLPRFHPDFVLQAVPASDRGNELMEELKSAMRAEATPTNNLTSINRDEESRWIDVTTAVIADATNFTIKQLRLRRLVKLRSSADREQLESVPNSFDGRTQAPSLYGNPYSIAQLTPSVDIISSVIEEQFVEEPIISFDETLIEAVEKMIAQTTEPPPSTPTNVSFVKADSDRSSRSSSRIREVVTVVADKDKDKDKPKDADGKSIDTTKAPEARLEVPRVECRKILLGSLETIAQEVADSRQHQAAGEGEPEHVHASERESYLREGIRAWFDNIEEAA